MRSVICTLFVVNRFSLKPITIGKRGDILLCTGGESLKAAVGHDAGIARYFDQNVFKTELESERPVSFSFSCYERAGRGDIIKPVRLRKRSNGTKNDESP